MSLERRTVFSRKVSSNETKEQVLAANVDVAFVVAAATDVNARRIERYLTIAWQSGAVPDRAADQGRHRRLNRTTCEPSSKLYRWEPRYRHE